MYGAIDTIFGGQVECIGLYREGRNENFQLINASARVPVLLIDININYTALLELWSDLDEILEVSG